MADQARPSAMAILLGPVDDPAALARAVAALPCAGLLTPAPADPDAARALVRACHDAGIACLFEDGAGPAHAAGADGAVVDPEPAAVRAARDRLGADAVLGARCASRHEAMEAGEAGAALVQFVGEEAVLDALVAWWAEIAVFPCLAAAPTPERAAPLIGTGADFVGIAAADWTDPARLGMFAAVLATARKDD